MTLIEQDQIKILIIKSKTEKHARSQVLKQFKSILLNSEDISPEAIENKFDKPDLIIIEGDKSLQNAAIIEASYAEIYFCEKLDEAELKRAVEDFEQRKRNFGS
ncbi:MAG: hypothetical protein HOA17_03120 [Candidatus Melainabacteria bacterium]|jgi:undecaprenyl pyrophosphate synthase|nr:hypothetical protein [Candidatus Melainabacteria bacterium]